MDKEKKNGRKERYSPFSYFVRIIVPNPHRFEYCRTTAPFSDLICWIITVYATTKLCRAFSVLISHFSLVRLYWIRPVALHDDILILPRSPRAVCVVCTDAVTNLNVGGHFFGFKSTIIRLVSAFVMVSTVWSAYCLLFINSRCPSALPFVKVRGMCPRALWSRRHWLLYNLSAICVEAKKQANECWYMLCR